MGKIRSDKYVLALTCIIVFFAITNIIWVRMDLAPPMWDQSQYLEGSKVLYGALVREGVLSFLKVFSETFKNKAPLIGALPIPFYVLFGEGYKSALLMNLVFLVLSSCYLYRLCMLIAGKKEAILSVFILNTFPLVFSLSREFFVDYGLMTFVIIWMFYLLRSNCFEEKQYVPILGIIFGLGMLMKISFLLYVLFPCFFLVIKRIIELKKLPMSYIKNIFLTLLIGALISGIWYFKNISFAISNVLLAGYGSVAKHYGTGDVFSIRAVLDYWLIFINHGISAYFFFLIIFMTAANIFVIIKKGSIAGIDSSHLCFLIIWVALPFAVLTFGVNKDIRYTIPFLPALAMLVGITIIQQLRIRKYGRLLLFVLLLFPLFNYLFISFYQKAISVRAGQFILLHNWLNFGHPPVQRGHWPDEEIIEFLDNDAIRTGKKNTLATLLFNHPYINEDNLNYYSKGTRFQTLYQTTEEIDKTVDRIERDSDYVVTKSGNIGPDFANIKNREAIKVVEEGRLKFRRIGAILHVPDGTTLTIYKKDSKYEKVYGSRKELGEYDGHSINFSDQIMLLDCKLERTEGGYRLVFLWECLDTISHDYNVFVHFYSDDDIPILNADHRPHAKYPTNEWRKGEVIRDEFDITTPLPAKFYVYIGLYEGATQVRLPVKNKPVADPDNVKGVRIL
ncbi:MAG TPA: glycosyltransferase family 39 protein [Syntrophales bacterium]|nr:glycosyltransferase family 39 protein [Syntrophales bacterium]